MSGEIYPDFLDTSDDITKIGLGTIITDKEKHCS
jgi:hypothetical protein